MLLFATRLCLFIICFMLMATVPCSACYSGLTLIPTTDTVGAGQYGIELQIDGSVPSVKADTFILNCQAGIGENIEAGVDFDFSENGKLRPFFNAKYVFPKQDLGMQALAVGISGLGEGVKASPYLVGSQDLGFARLHAGAIGVEGKTRWFTGIDGAAAENLTLMADYTSGVENYFSIGANYQFTDRLAILSGVQFSNSGDETLFTVHICLAGPLAG